MKSRTLLLLVAVSGSLIVAPGARADDNPYLAACRLFGGTYEEHRVGCDPECDVTYVCRFADGSGRSCTGDGECGPISLAPPTPATSLSPVDTVKAASPAENASSCEARCEGMKPRKAEACRRSCVTESPAPVTETATEEVATRPASLCDRCLQSCRAKCPDDLSPKDKRVCESGCDHTCLRECEG
jgi:hypothetical protein